jgi:hypothetical protein
MLRHPERPRFHKRAEGSREERLSSARGDLEARFFWGQAANEAVVISSTDWDMGRPAPTLRRVA